MSKEIMAGTLGLLAGMGLLVPSTREPETIQSTGEGMFDLQHREAAIAKRERRKQKRIAIAARKATP